MNNFEHISSQGKESADQETSNRLIEAARFSFADLQKFLDSDKEIAIIERDLTLDDLEALKKLPYEAEVLKNQYGTFSWKGHEEGVRHSQNLDSRVWRALFHSPGMTLDLHNHPSQSLFYAHDRSYPSFTDLAVPRTHDIEILGVAGISVTSPLLYEPSTTQTKFLYKPEFMFDEYMRHMGKPFSYSQVEGEDLQRFLEAAGAKFTFYPWEDAAGIRKNILERPTQDASYLTWAVSENPYRRSMALSVFKSMYGGKDFTADPGLFEVLERFCNDSESFVRDEANETLKRIKARIGNHKK